MTIENLSGMELTHKTFGKVKVIGVEIDYSNMSSAKIVVKLPEREAKFQVISLDEFFIDVPDDVKFDIENIKSSAPKLQSKYINNISEEKNISCYQFDEYGHKLSEQDWENSKQYVTDFWWSSNGTPAPVMCDEHKVYISAKALCEDVGVNKSFYDEVYDICNGSILKTTFNGHKCRFAKKYEIDEVIKSYKEL